MLTAMAIALAAAACFSVGSALQHRVADRSPERDSAATLVGRMVRRPSWLVGLGLSAAAFVLQGLALHFGTLTMVQPVVVSGMAFAVFARAALDRHWPSAWQVAWSLVTATGLGVFLVALPPAPDQPPEPHNAFWFVAAGLVIVGLVLVAERWLWPEHPRRGVALAAAAGLLFGLVAGLLKLVLRQLTIGIGDALAHWSLWTMSVVGVGALLLNQRAYQVTSLAVSAPVLNLVQVLTAIAFGVAVFGERPAQSPPAVIGEVAGLILILLGIRQLTVGDRSEPATSDLVQRDAGGHAGVQRLDG